MGLFVSENAGVFLAHKRTVNNTLNKIKPHYKMIFYQCKISFFDNLEGNMTSIQRCHPRH